MAFPSRPLAQRGRFLLLKLTKKQKKLLEDLASKRIL
jgi:hypothetical protein